jgi:hypothetical protein
VEVCPSWEEDCVKKIDSDDIAIYGISHHGEGVECWFYVLIVIFFTTSMYESYNVF